MIDLSASGENRYRTNKDLNLVNFLPSISKETETEQFTQFIEDFLNTLFDGNNGMSQIESDVSVSGSYYLSGTSGNLIPYGYPNPNPLSAVTVSADNQNVDQVTITSASDTSGKISIIEKVYRLTELKDPDLIDIDYIQYFASNMGYNIDVYRNEVGNIGESIGNYAERSIYSTSATSASDANKYLRFMVSNLPNWYKIKTTDSAMKVMLYSFGLIADIINYYTSNYLRIQDGGQWTADYNGDLSNIPKNYFNTPHFAIRINVDESQDLISDSAKRASVIRAIQSIQPINTVFRNLSGYCSRDINLNMSMMTRLSRYIRIEAVDPIELPLIAWYKGEQNLVDSIAGRNGTAQPDTSYISYVSGVTGQAFHFELPQGLYPDPYGFSVANDPVFDFGPTDTFKIDLWAKISADFSIGGFFFVSKGGLGGWGVGVTDLGDEKYEVVVFVGSNYYTAGSLPYDDVFHHFVLSYTNGIWTYSVDNLLLLTTASHPISHNLNDLIVADNYGSDYSAIACDIDEIKILGTATPLIPDFTWAEKLTVPDPSDYGTSGITILNSFNLPACYGLYFRDDSVGGANTYNWEIGSIGSLSQFSTLQNPVLTSLVGYAHNASSYTVRLTVNGSYVKTLTVNYVQLP